MTPKPAIRIKSKMRILFIICSNKMDAKHLPNIVILNDYINRLRTDHEVDLCGISSNDDFAEYDSVVGFKYKIVNPHCQLSKVCDFIANNDADYDWYIKMRPEIKLLQDIDFTLLSESAINARARVYIGPKKIPYGNSVRGPGYFSHVNESFYSRLESAIILDDQIYIFNKLILDKWKPRDSYPNRENEWVHASYWRMHNIPLNVIGLNLEITIKDSLGTAFSGDI